MKDHNEPQQWLNCSIHAQQENGNSTKSLRWKPRGLSKLVPEEWSECYWMPPNYTALLSHFNILEFFMVKYTTNSSSANLNYNSSTVCKNHYAHALTICTQFTLLKLTSWKVWGGATNKHALQTTSYTWGAQPTAHYPKQGKHIPHALGWRVDKPKSRSSLSTFK